MARHNYFLYHRCVHLGSVLVILVLLIFTLSPSDKHALAAIPRKKIIFIMGACTTLESGPSTSQSDDFVFSNIQNILKTEEFGYRDDDFLLYSYTGGRMVPISSQWRWWHNYYSETTPASQNLTASANRVYELMEQYRREYPETPFVLIGHSLGGIVAYEVVLQKIDFSSTYPNGLVQTVISVDSPINGAPPIPIGAVGNLQPCIGQGAAIQELVRRYNIGSTWRYWMQLASGIAKDKGVQTVTAGNYYDGVYNPRACRLPFSGDYSVQWIFDSSAIPLFYGFFASDLNPLTCLQRSHSSVLTSSVSARTIARYIGRQLN
ncbi:MAG: hypothetical protein K8L97_20570 [Anaerolineae bacterium]|nr:hypothetical protein [Anaerolineae bacterium]